MVVFLIGFMGCGKSTVGRSVANRLGYRFIDMDNDIEERAGLSVAGIFERHGEEYFRRLEREAIERYAAMDDLVVATGGGAPCGGDNMRHMNEAGKTVYLKMSPEKLVTRLSQHGRAKRPLLRGKDDAQVLSFICERLPEREPYYGCAALVIDCEGVSDDYIAGHVAEFIARSGEPENVESGTPPAEGATNTPT